MEEALQMNDPYTIHCKLLDIYVECGKAQELAALVELMLRKYRQAGVHVRAGAACYRLGLLDKARQVRRGHEQQTTCSKLEKQLRNNETLDLPVFNRQYYVNLFFRMGIYQMTSPALG